MSYDDLVPLYKILCLALIFLVPLAPAWALYRIAPSDKFLATGNFSGFKINATGAAAIYIVLFSVIVLQTNNIMNDISNTESLKKQVVDLQKKRPWTVRYKLKLMTDSLHEIAPLAYKKIVQQDSITCMPTALHVENDFRTLTFYADNRDVSDLGDPINSQVIVNGYGTSRISIPRKSADVDTANRILTINPIIYLGSANQTRAGASQVAVLGPNDGTVNPAPLTNQ